MTTTNDSGKRQGTLPPPMNRAPTMRAAEQRTSGELGADAKAGESTFGLCANAALLALARAARSFSLYDAKNDAVRQLLADFKSKVEAVLKSFGALELEIQPFEFTARGETIYRETDRERSLAFRLFRDGVRRLAFQPGAEWEDFVRLLEILSLRFTGVRQQEDDLVTLLRKTRFKGITYYAVEGFVPDEVEPEPPMPKEFDSREKVPLPEQWDRESASFEQVGRALYRSVPEPILQRLRAEEDPGAVVRSAVRALAEIVAMPQVEWRLLEEYAVDTRAFLEMERAAEALLEMARLLISAAAADPAKRKAAFAATMGEEALRIVVGALPPESEPMPALVEVLEADPAESLRILGLLLTEVRDIERTGLICKLAAVAGKTAPEQLLELVRASTGPARLGLMNAVSQAAPERAAALAVELGVAADVRSHAQLIEVLANSDVVSSMSLAKALLESKDEAIRLRTIDLLEKRAGQRGFSPLLGWFEKETASRSVSKAEAEKVGCALARLSARTAISTFTGWEKSSRKGFFAKLLKGDMGNPGLFRAAAAGLELLAHGPQMEEVLALLKTIGQRSDPETRALCDAILARKAKS